MVLIDEKFLENMLQRKDDLIWKRPTDQTVKSKLSRELKNDLDNYPNIPDDIKVKQHLQHLTRFLQTKRQLQQDPDKNLIDFEPVKNLIDVEPSKNLIDFETDKNLIDFEPVKKLIDTKDAIDSEPIKAKKITKKKASVSIRHSARKPKKIVWEQWTK
jgi:hypothetical protein